MAQNKKKTSILSRLRNYFFAGAVVLIPIGITLYLSLFIIKNETYIERRGKRDWQNICVY